jgi:hypothetical protein
MFFTRTQKYRSLIAQEDFRNLLIGNHVRIHNLDFEVFEQEHKLTIVPHAEQVTDLKTLPITNVDLKKDGNTTHIIITSKIRMLDYGGPLLIVVFCAFLFIASIILYYVGHEQTIATTMLAASTLLFTVFWVRMEMGYFDYVRKIRSFIKTRLQLVS